MRDGNIKARTAFTLVELLVVVAIIGGLIALLLPAVQSARESARQVTCRNNLKQLALGWHLHTSTHGIFPSGGWAGLDSNVYYLSFTGDPDRGFGKSQPGTWTFSILPYIEQQSLHDAGRGRGTRNAIDPDGFLLRYSTPVPTFVCSTRRRQGTVPVYHQTHSLTRPANIAPADWQRFDLSKVAVVDYAANQASDTERKGDSPTGDLPSSYEEADDPNFVWRSGLTVSGVCDMRSSLRETDIEDGLSQTYMLGESALPRDLHDGFDTGRNDLSFAPSVYDVYSLNNFFPMSFAFVTWGNDFGDDFIENVLLPGPDPDSTTYDTILRRFGSAHPSHWNVAFCDGSVRAISYDIDPATHVYLGFRDDGVAVDLSKLE